MAGQEYSLDRTIEFPNMVARIFRPVLTDEERNRRHKAIHKATADLLLEVERIKK